MAKKSKKERVKAGWERLWNKLLSTKDVCDLVKLGEDVERYKRIYGEPPTDFTEEIYNRAKIAYIANTNINFRHDLVDKVRLFLGSCYAAQLKYSSRTFTW